MGRAELPESFMGFPEFGCQKTQVGISALLQNFIFFFFHFMFWNKLYYWVSLGFDVFFFFCQLFLLCCSMSFGLKYRFFLSFYAVDLVLYEVMNCVLCCFVFNCFSRCVIGRVVVLWSLYVVLWLGLGSNLACSVCFGVKYGFLALFLLGQNLHIVLLVLFSNQNWSFILIIYVDLQCKTLLRWLPRWNSNSD